MKFVMESADEFPVLPDDTVIQVVVDSTEIREVPARDGRDGWEKLNFRFKIIELPSHLEAEFASMIGGTIFGSVSARLTTHPDNKLRQWAESLLGLSLNEPGFELEQEMLVGRKARAIVGSYQKKNSTSRNNTVTALLPLVPATVGGGSPSFSFDDEPPF